MATASVSLCGTDEKLTAFLELEAAKSRLVGETLAQPRR